MESKMVSALAIFCVLFAAVSANDTMPLGSVGRRTYHGSMGPRPVTHAAAKTFCQGKRMRLPTIQSTAEKNFFVSKIDAQMFDMIGQGQTRVPAFWTSTSPRGQTCEYMYYTRTNIGFAFQSCNARLPAPLCET